jgi:membrane-associated phospholipid phosphatase
VQVTTYASLPDRVRPDAHQEDESAKWVPKIGARGRLTAGFALLVAVAVGGAYFTGHPGPNPVDSWANNVLPNEWSLKQLLFVTDLGRPRVVIPGVAVCFFMALFWDRRRALTCLIAPAAAVGITEYVAKPAVGRMLGGSLSYPSGHMTAVAALTTVFVLTVPPRFRWFAAVLAVCVDIGVGVTLILLRWHYLTDVIAGACVAVGTTLVVDTVVHMLRLPPPFTKMQIARTASSSEP